MRSIPQKFTPDLQQLPADLGERGNEARDRLAAKGFVVLAGVTRKNAGAVVKMAKQPHIVKYCPNDQVSRFPTVEAVEKHLTKKGGRATFILARTVTGEALRDDQPLDEQITEDGYSWTGLQPCKQLPNNPTTFAVRVGEGARGYHAGEPFTTVTLAGSTALYGMKRFGLETWEDNPKAVEAYEEAGWVHVASEPGERELPEGGTVPDIRRFYAYPDEFLPLVAEAA